MGRAYPQAVKDCAIQLRLAGETYRWIASYLTIRFQLNPPLNWRTIQAWCTNADARTPAQRRKSGHTVAALRRWVEQFDLREVDLVKACVAVPHNEREDWLILHPREESVS